MAGTPFGKFHVVRIFAVEKFSGNADMQSYSFNLHGEFYFSCIYIIEKKSAFQ